jgi:hypothetical protein
MKNSKNIAILLFSSIFILLFGYLIWFGNEISPGGNFSSNYNQIEIKNNNIEVDTTFKSLLKYFGEELNSLNESRIQSISTLKGNNTILQITSDLKSNETLKILAENLVQYKVFNIINYDFTATISIGDPNEITGASGGYLFLKKVNKIIKIDNYRAEK